MAYMSGYKGDFYRPSHRFRAQCHDSLPFYCLRSASQCVCTAYREDQTLSPIGSKRIAQDGQFHCANVLCNVLCNAGNAPS